MERGLFEQPHDGAYDAVGAAAMFASVLEASHPHAERDAFLTEVIAGLTRSPKRLPGKFLWDEAGSILFDRICDSPDYYPTKREMALLPHVAREIADRVGPRATIVEFGSGAARKIRTLLDALHEPARYVAIDISRDYLEASLRGLAPDYPGVEMISVCADYSRPVWLPVDIMDGPVLGFFPGTSIGNLTPAEAGGFLERARDTLGSGRFLIGTDPTQDEEQLLHVYGSCSGLMPALHRNFLVRMNRELGTGIALDAFHHEARVHHDPFRVEAHLVASRANQWRVGDDWIAFEAGESVRTDTSHKYAPEAFVNLAVQSGWASEQGWVDPGGFCLHLLAA